jgi:hypothetical protein
VRGGFGPRFVLEAGFLIAVAVAAGVAELSATAIIVVMAVAWLLVCLFELALWSEGPRFPAFDRTEEEEAEHESSVTDSEPDPEPVAARREGEGT